MLMQLIRKLFNRPAVPAVDRAVQLQNFDAHIAEDLDEAWADFIEPVRSVPHVIHFDCRDDVIELGYFAAARPHRIRRINLEPHVACRAGATAKVNRLIRRGYYQSRRHAA